MDYKLNYKLNKLLIFNNLAIRHNALFIKSDITRHSYSRFIQIIKNFKKQNQIKPIFILSSDNKLTYYIGGYKNDLDEYNNVGATSVRNKNNILSIEAEILQLTYELIIEYYDNIINDKCKNNENIENKYNEDNILKDNDKCKYDNKDDNILNYQYIISDEKYLNNFSVFNDDIRNNIKICDKKILNHDFIKRNKKYVPNYFPVEGIVRIQNINYNCGNWKTIAKWCKDTDDIQNFIIHSIEFDLIYKNDYSLSEIEFDDIDKLDDNIYDLNDDVLKFDINLDVDLDE